jgi:hypothetical protein
MEYELARISCPAQLPDGFTYLWTDDQPAAFDFSFAMTSAMQHALKTNDHASKALMNYPPGEEKHNYNSQ